MDKPEGTIVSAVDALHVSVASDVGPVFGEDSLCILINFYLPLDLKPCSLKPKVKAPYSCEQRAHCQSPLHLRLLRRGAHRW